MRLKRADLNATSFILGVSSTDLWSEIVYDSSYFFIKYERSGYMITKVCTKCGLELPIEEFHWRNKTAGTRRSECKACHNLMSKKDYDKKRN